MSIPDAPTRGPARPGPYVIAGILLATAIVVPLFVPAYSIDEPRLAGMPFFYWYQMMWIPFTAGLVGCSYWLVAKPGALSTNLISAGSWGAWRYEEQEPVTKAFNEQFHKMHGRVAGMQSVQVGSAAMMLFTAITKAGSPRARGISSTSSMSTYSAAVTRATTP